ncbi:MAG: 3-deoxy-manno-octulosonate cytidylyltransferase (CMP-KDO synthetase) [Rhodospirillaceae bacterium]|nr:MAG: 3-deoxy-manno-octulosonate cytidylyltransferase (CMP-KDO synthetase) [Rhodospirillaceae bacterium]
MTPLVVIPARMASTRLPGKPLADIHGVPMIVRVLRQAEAAAIGPVVVACAEPAIAKAVQTAGGRAVLTDPDHPSGSDRVFEAVRRIDPNEYHDVVVNVQGDLPTLDSRVLAAALTALAEPTVDIATLVALLTDPREATDPNVVKAVAGFPAAAVPGTIARALYFSRATVPSGQGPLFHHIGLYAYRRAALARFVALPPGILERRERLEQLRALENGLRINAVLVDMVPLGVDTPNDLARARALLAPA